MSFLKRNRVFIAFFSIIALFWLNSQYIPKADAKSCGIYQAYHASLAVDYPQAFLPLANPVRTEQDDWFDNLPSEFSRDIGEIEILDSKTSPESYENPVYVKFRFDTETFRSVSGSKRYRIRSCFDGIDSPPSVVKLPKKSIDFLLFSVESQELNLPYELNLLADYSTIHNVSSPLISADGRHGLIFSISYCGGLCGGGGYYLFENINGDWKQIGFHQRWVS